MDMKRFILRASHISHATKTLTPVVQGWYERAYWLHPAPAPALRAFRAVQAGRASRAACHAAWIWSLLGPDWAPAERTAFAELRPFVLHAPGATPWRSLLDLSPDGALSVRPAMIATAASLTLDELTAIGANSPFPFSDLVDRAIAQLRAMGRTLSVDWESTVGYHAPGRRRAKDHVDTSSAFFRQFAPEDVSKPSPWPFPGDVAIPAAGVFLERTLKVVVGPATLRRWRDNGIPAPRSQLAQALHFLVRSVNSSAMATLPTYPLDLYRVSDAPIGEGALPEIGQGGPCSVRQLVWYIRHAGRTLALCDEEPLEALARWYWSVFPPSERLLFNVDQFHDALYGHEPMDSCLARVQSAQMRTLVRVAQVVADVHRPLVG